MGGFQQGGVFWGLVSGLNDDDDDDDDDEDEDDDDDYI